MSDDPFPSLEGDAIRGVIDRIHDCLDAEEGALVAQIGLSPEHAWSTVQGCIAAAVVDRFLELPVERERVLAAVSAFVRHVQRFAVEQWDREHPNGHDDAG